LSGLQNWDALNEHEPKHIHVTKGEDYAKIELGTLKVTANFMKPK